MSATGQTFFLMNIVSEQSPALLILGPIMGLAYAWLLYNHEKHKQNYSKLLIRFLFALRFISISLITVLLLNLLLKYSSNRTEKPLLIFALDNSASLVSGKDSAIIKNDFIPQIQSVEKELSEKYDVHTVLFGNAVQNKTTPDFKDKESDLSQLLNDIGNNYANRNTGALIICSDGIINRGSTGIEAVSKFNFPVYTIALGDTNQTADILIRKINHNQVVYFGNKFPVEIAIQANRLKGKSATVSIYKDNTKKSEQSVKLTGDNFMQSLNFVLEAEKPGVQKYRVVINSVEGEVNTTNNFADFIVDVIDTREKILILAEAPHPDIAALKESIESGQTYETEISMVFEFNKPLKPYSLVILHSLSVNHLSLLNELNNNNQPYLLIHPKANENLPGLKITSTYNKQNETEAVYNKNFTLFGISDDLKNYIREFPAIQTHFGQYMSSPGSSALLFQKIGMVETENPLLLFSDNNGKKTGIIAGDGIWRWRLRDFADHGNHNLFNELVSRCVQYLSVKADKSFFRVNTRKIINENEAVEFNAEVYNPSYQLITEPEVNIIITDSTNKQFNYTMSKQNNSYFLNAGLLPPGEYKYKATVKNNTQVFSNSGTVTIKAMLAEKNNTVADHSLLHQLSGNSGGKLFFMNQLEQLKKDLESNETIKPVTYTQKELNDLIDLKWIFFLIVGLLSIEWFLRKREGSV